MNEIKGKQRARKLALQALYQWHFSGSDLVDIEAQFRQLNNMKKVNEAYFSRLLHEIPKHIRQLESALEPFLDRSISHLNPIELTTLLIGAFELIHCPEIPYKVVLNESITLTKSFGSQDGYKYVNGVLHHLSKTIRAVEMDG